MDDFNPYAAPKAMVSAGAFENDSREGQGVWQDGKTLLMSRSALLPSRCIKCNAPATKRLKIAFAWPSQAHFLWWIVVPAIGLFVYLILVLTIRRTATIDVPICELHRTRRIRNLWISWVCGLSGLILVVVVCAIRLANPVPSTGGFLGVGVTVTLLLVVGTSMILFGMVYGVLRAQLLTVGKMTKAQVWLNQVAPAYLETLAPIPVIQDPVANDDRPQSFEF